MAETETDIIKRMKGEGKTAIQIHQWLRENNMPLPWVEVKHIFLSVT